MHTLVLITLAVLLACPAGSSAADSNNLFENEPIQPVEPAKGLDKRKVALGDALFNDPRLSANETMSCAFCHKMDTGGTLNQALAPAGVSGKHVPINVPTVFGSGHNFVQFWDGRAATLEDQISGPIENPDEMGSSWPKILEKLQKDPKYSKAFLEIYNSQPTKKAVTNAIAEFERSLLPVNSPFDNYLRGDKKAISPQAAEGYALFKNLGCSSCHQGANVGGNMFQKFGIMNNYFKDRGNIIDKDYGRFNVTKSEDDRFFFKVPSLRNVEQTAPYFHDGSAKTLEEAVDVMAKYQLGRKLKPAEREKLVAFLKSLTGKIPENEK